MIKKAKIIVRKNKCYQAIGIKKMIDQEGNEIVPEEDVKLCSCGLSKNMPFCDGGHKEKVFDETSGGEIVINQLGGEGEPILLIDKNGPIHVKGDVEIESDVKMTVADDHVMTFCRCGESKTKPFCDGTHMHCRFDRYDE